jgi:hypothetical protein
MFNIHVIYGPKSAANDHVHCNSSSLLTPILHCMKLFVPLMPAGETQQESPATVVLQLQFMLCVLRSKAHTAVSQFYYICGQVSVTVR